MATLQTSPVVQLSSPSTRRPPYCFMTFCWLPPTPHLGASLGDYQTRSKCHACAVNPILETVSLTRFWNSLSLALSPPLTNSSADHNLFTHLDPAIFPRPTGSLIAFPLVPHAIITHLASFASVLIVGIVILFSFGSISGQLKDHPSPAFLSLSIFSPLCTSCLRLCPIVSSGSTDMPYHAYL